MLKNKYPSWLLLAYISHRKVMEYIYFQRYFLPENKICKLNPFTNKAWKVEMVDWRYVQIGGFKSAKLSIQLKTTIAIKNNFYLLSPEGDFILRKIILITDEGTLLNGSPKIKFCFIL